MKLSGKRVILFQHMIFDWWHSHRRDLPWRHTHDPYCIMVSEVMLQQTQVSRVISKYEEFLHSFPTVSALAQGSPSQVLKIWKGMGYNRRALYVLKAARIICDEYNGHFPTNYELLTKLPGLGTYTARAILVFAYAQEVPLVDTNIRQIITHFFFKDQPQKESVIEEVAGQLVPSGKSWEWHQALMDYGALELRNKPINKYTNKQIKTIPFRESNRFYRGRIIDQLRQGSVSRNKCIADFQQKYGKPKLFLNTIIAGLERDRLLVQFGRGSIGLPND